MKTRHYLKKGVSVIVWDAGPETIDRYAAVCYGKGFLVRDAYKRPYHLTLVCAEGGNGFSQWNEYSLRNFNGGKRVSWESLSKATQQHITQRVSE